MTQKIRMSGSSQLDLGDVMWVTAYAGQKCAIELHDKVAAHVSGGNGHPVTNSNSVIVKCHIPACYDCDIEVRITVDQNLARRWYDWSHPPEKEI